MNEKLTSGLEAMLTGRIKEKENNFTSNRPTGRPKKENSDSFASRPKKKTSLQIEVDTYKVIQQIAWDNRVSDNVIVNQALRLFIEKYEKANGPVVVQESRDSINSIDL